MPKSISSPPAVELARDLSSNQALAVVVGSVIGSGIFLVPTEMMQAVGSIRLVYLAWVVGGLLSFFGAATYAELGAMKPEAGGEYVYIRDAYGPLAGFLYGWTWFLVAKPASIGTLTVGMVRILESFPVFGFLSQAAWHTPFAVNYGQMVAIAATLLITSINYLGIKRAGEFQLIFTLVKVAILLAIVGVGFSYSSGHWSNFATVFTGAKGGFAGFIAALVAALWAYDGWNDLNQVAGEVQHPQRSIPIALIAGVAIVGLLYISTNAAIQYVLPAGAIARSPSPTTQAIGLILGWRGAWLVSAGMALSILVAMNGTIMSGARVPYAMARDRYFFTALAKVHPQYHTPHIALLVQALFTIGLLLLGGNYRQFFSLAIFSEWLFYMLAASTVFVFRRRDPGANRPFHVFGYPVVPALFVSAAGLLLYFTFTDNFVNSGLGVLVILAGIPVFYFFRNRRTVND
jgi:APA family basic amino acid/polyamine antiporter